MHPMEIPFTVLGTFICCIHQNSGLIFRNISGVPFVPKNFQYNCTLNLNFNQVSRSSAITMYIITQNPTKIWFEIMEKVEPPFVPENFQSNRTSFHCLFQSGDRNWLFWKPPLIPIKYNSTPAPNSSPLDYHPLHPLDPYM